MYIAVFLLVLAFCIVFDYSILYALCFGYICFSIAAYRKGFHLTHILRMSWDGAKQTKNIMILFVLLGMITGIWRSSGTISWIVYYSADFINPSFFVLSCFLLSCLMATITGTAFGTSSTMGIVLIIVARINGFDEIMTAGAVLAGGYFGDRFSPMSSTARFVCELTDTDYYENISMLIKTMVVPFILSCLCYIIFCKNKATGSLDISIAKEFVSLFNIKLITILPAVLIIIISVFKVNIRINLLINIIVSCFISFTVQNNSLTELGLSLLMGHRLSPDSPLSSMINGGGIFSMLKPALIIFISSSYVRIFEKTKMLKDMEDLAMKLKNHLGNYPSTVIISIITAAFSCNQIFCIILTNYLCKNIYENKKELASGIFNSAVIIAPLIPWSIASAVPFAMMKVNAKSLFFAFFLFLTPLVNLIWYLGRNLKLKKISPGISRS